MGEQQTERADFNVWRKRILQLPKVGWNPRHWMFGFAWDAPEDEGFLTLSFGPIGFMWDSWP